jgi:prepilin-type N-terminal cleavage/methylation domain-containing protein
MAAVRARPPAPLTAKGEAGFTLVEMLVSLVLLLLALALAGQLLIESQQTLVDSAAEMLDNPTTLAVARLRNDVVSSSRFLIIPILDTGGYRLILTGHPAGTVVYEVAGTDLVRRVFDGLGVEVGQGVALRGVATGHFVPTAVPETPLLKIEVAYAVHRGRRSPLPTVPGTRGPKAKAHMEVMFLLPRGRP